MNSFKEMTRYHWTIMMRSDDGRNENKYCDVLVEKLNHGHSVAWLAVICQEIVENLVIICLLLRRPGNRRRSSIVSSQYTVTIVIMTSATIITCELHSLSITPTPLCALQACWSYKYQRDINAAPPATTTMTTTYGDGAFSTLNLK